MALSDLAVFSEYFYTSSTEVLRQQVNLFNGATAGAIVLGAGAHQGDFSDRVMYAAVQGLVRRRNAYGSGAVVPKHLTHLIDTMVKVASGTPPLEMNPSQFLWIQRNPEEAGVVYGQQLAVQVLADMLNSGLGALYAAMAGISSNVLDITARTTPADKMNFGALAEAHGLLGDQSGGGVAAWILHSKPMFDIFQNQLNNAERLFTYGNVSVIRDPFGKMFVMTDSPALVNLAATPDVYHTFGLTQGAIVIEQNNDYIANEETKNGDENITRTFQAEWSFEMGIKGFAWDKANGGKSPTDAALLTGSNWDRIATSHKDLPGVIIESH